MAASIPLMIPYSGTIEADGAKFNGDGQFKFAIINGHAECQASPIGAGCVTYWSNDGTLGGIEPTISVSIPVSNGNFAVKLGDISVTNMQAISEDDFDNTTTYLRIWFNDGVTGFQQLSPDRQLVSVPYAFRADVADKYTGTIGSSQITAGAVGVTQINKAQVQSRVTQTCSPGLSIREIKEDGTVTCENDDTGSSYTAGTGISIVGTSIGIANGGVGTTQIADNVVTSAKIAAGAVGSAQINNTEVQQRVSGTCAAGSSIRTVNADGTVVCETVVATTSLSAQAVQTIQIVVAAASTEIIGVDFTCPANGFVIAQGYITADINHTNGITDNMYVKISKSIETGCCVEGWSQTIVQSAFPTTGANRSPVHVTARFACTAGTPERYRINANMVQGADASDKAGWGTIVVQYVPN